MEYNLEFGGEMVRVRSLCGQTKEATGALRTLLYLQEIDRQAAIFTASFERAHQVALNTTTKMDDSTVWADLQCGLFSAIIVQRLLRPEPTQVRKYRHHSTKAESVAYAVDRGKRLCSLLGLPDDSTVFTVSAVRNSFEHVNERLDALMHDDVHSVSDWYISSGLVGETASHDGPSAHNLRVFIPSTGLLLYDDQLLDLFLLDLTMIDLRLVVKEVHPSLTAQIEGMTKIGSHRIRQYNGLAEQRTSAWLADRHARGYGPSV